MEHLFGLVQERSVDAGPPPLIWKVCVEQVSQARPVLLSEYMGRHGLSELPTPAWVDPENATVWHRTAKGGIDSCRKRLCDSTGNALVVFLERDFLLAPPFEEDEAEEQVVALANPFAGLAVDAVAEVASGPDERAEAEPASDNSPEAELGFRCTMLQRSGRRCLRPFTTKAGMTRHQTVSPSHRKDD